MDKPTFGLFCVGGDIKQASFLSECKARWSKRSTDKDLIVEHELRRYKLFSCDLHCGTIAGIPFYDRTHLLGAIWLVSRELADKNGFANPDHWLLFLINALRLPLVVFHEFPEDPLEADQSEHDLRKRISTAGFSGDEIKFFRAPKPKDKTAMTSALHDLFGYLDGIPVTAPIKREKFVGATCRVPIFLLDEKEKLRDGQIIELRKDQTIETISTDYSMESQRKARVIEIEGYTVLRPGQCAMVTLSLNEPWRCFTGKHFMLKTHKELYETNGFGYVLPQR